MTQGLFVLDLDRCTGCAACVVACTNENPVSDGLSWRSIQTFNEARLPMAPVFHYSLACNHCVDPACLTNCPANAYTKDPATGAVLIEPEKCMGCRYCSWVCPYDSPRFNPASGVMEKCTFCVHRQEQGLDPACVTACPLDALRFEAEAEPRTASRPGFPDTGLGPAVRLEGERQQAPPRMTAAPAPVSEPASADTYGWQARISHWVPSRGRRGAVTSGVFDPRGAEPYLTVRRAPRGEETALGAAHRRPQQEASEIYGLGLRSEWSLWAFTSVATLLVAWFTAATALGHAVFLPVFASAGLIAMIVSALHLGRITRIWRAVLNVRSSWISREVAFFSVFFGSACGLGLVGGAPEWVSWATAAAGFAALFSMDMVYRVPGQAVAAVPHSAMATLGAAYYVGLLLAAPELALPAALAKLILYLIRGSRTPLLAALRIGLGILLPCILLVLGATTLVFLLGAAFIGEAIDRAEFYASLQFLTPSRQIERDLSRAA